MRRLKILNYAWHAGHQYELHKLPHQFTLVVRPGVPGWKFKHRPLSPSVRVAQEDALGLRAFDAAILHFDEHVLEPWVGGEEHPFLYFQRVLEGVPKVAICHGTAPKLEDGSVDEAKRAAIVEAVGDTWVVCNSHGAMQGWGFANARTIWHGFDPAEYPPGDPDRGVLTIGNFQSGRQAYQGLDVYRRVASEVECDLLWSRAEREGFREVAPDERPLWLRKLLYDAFKPTKRKPHRELSGVWRRWVGVPYARRRFGAYRALIRRYGVYFNPTQWSPMPRSRAEAMISGVALVTTNHHDEERWLDNEVNGFYSNDPGQLLDYVRYCRENPEKAREVGLRGRERATEVFALSRFHAEWEALLRERTE